MKIIQSFLALSFLFLFGPAFCQSQRLARSLSFDLDYKKGYLIEVPNVTTHLINSSPVEFQFRVMKQTNGKREWEKLYKYPRYGLAFSYYNSLNPTVGEAVSLMYSGDFPLFQLKKSSINMLMGIGGAYLSNPYDRIQNPKNLINGSHLNVAINLRFVYRQYISERLRLNFDIGMLHFSNGGSQQPNWSTNHISLGAGITWFPFLKPTENLQDTVSYPEIDRKWHLNAYFAGFWVDQLPTGGPKFPVWNLNGGFSKLITKRMAVVGGVDVLHNGLYPNTISGYEIIQYSPWRVSIFAGIELPMYRFAPFLQVAYYVYKPQSFDSNFYQRYGFKYYFLNNMYAVYGVRTKLGSVDNLEFGLGFKW